MALYKFRIIIIIIIIISVVISIQFQSWDMLLTHYLLTVSHLGFALDITLCHYSTLLLLDISLDIT